MKRNYDTVAFFYDRLARLVLGASVAKAQLYLLQFIPAKARLLIVGGGTGWVLEEIVRIHPAGLDIIYVDAAAQMIRLAKKRAVGGNRVTFIASPVESAALAGQFDVVLTPFLFDNFSEKTMEWVFAGIDTHLAPGGRWLHCDFQNTGVMWQKILLKVMYLFFRLACGIEATRMPDTAACFGRYQYQLKEEQTFKNGFIASRVYGRVKSPE
jgi:ubiquinone/menaquinone biosynthesis C-methylase UbiE